MADLFASVNLTGVRESPRPGTDHREVSKTHGIFRLAMLSIQDSGAGLGMDRYRQVQHIRTHCHHPVALHSAAGINVVVVEETTSSEVSLEAVVVLTTIGLNSFAETCLLRHRQGQVGPDIDLATAGMLIAATIADMTAEKMIGDHRQNGLTVSVNEIWTVRFHVESHHLLSLPDSKRATRMTL